MRQSHYKAYVSNIKVTALGFADDAGMSVEVLVMALEVLHDIAKPLSFEVSQAVKYILLMHMGMTLRS